MKTKTIILSYLLTVLFVGLFFLPGLLNAKPAADPIPDNTISRILEIDKISHLEPSWLLIPDKNTAPRTIKMKESIKNREFILQASMKGMDNFCGTKVLGTPMDLKIKLYSQGLSEVEVSMKGYVIDTFEVDGSSGTGVEIDRTIRVTTTTTPDDYTVELKVKNKGFKPFRTTNWPPRRTELEEENSFLTIQESSIAFPAALNTQLKLNDWILSMKIGYALLKPDFKRYTFIGAPFEIPDKRKTPKGRLAALEKALQQSVLCLEPGTLSADQPGKVIDAINRSYKLAEPVKTFAKEFKIFLIGNAHIDIAWLWRMRETVMVARNTYDTVMKNMDEFPELHYGQSQAVTYYWMEKQYPEIFERIKQRIKEGKWEIVGGMWVEPDCNLISGESWVRQLIFGKRYFKSRFGIDVDTGWNPDSFGYNWNMPQIYAKSGIKRFITQKIWWNDTTVFPHFIFWWQGVDGTKLLTYFPPAAYDTAVRFPQDVVNITRYEATTGYKKALLLYGIGDHGGGPNRETLNRIRSYGKLYIAPEFIHSKSIDFLKNLETDLKTDIPTWNDELYLEYHRGTYTTQAKVKKNNRESESLLSAAEKYSSIAFILDKSYPSQLLEEAWKTVLTNQFHDILPGSSITPVYRDALEDYAKAREKIEKATINSTAKIINQIDTSKVNGFPVIVMNSLSWKRTEVVSVDFPLGPTEIVKVLDPSGNPIPFELKIKDPEPGATVRFTAYDIPPIGYAVYSIEKKESTGGGTEKVDVPVPVTSDDFIQMENKFFVLKINKKSGNISSLIDKRLNKEFIQSGKEGNVLQVHEDRPQNWDAWDIGYTGRNWEINKAESVELVENTPIRQVVKIEKTFLGFTKGREAPTETFPSSFFTQYITLYRDIDRIDIKTDADWWEDHLLLKAAFPVTISSDFATYEIPFASIKRTTKFETLWEKARYEVSAHRWADLSDNTAGVSLLNNCKYGYDIHGNVMRITLLRSPTWPDPGADRGKHTFTYSIYTHPGTVNDGKTIQRGQELNIPLYTVLTGNRPGVLPTSYSFFALDSKNVILETLKKAEDDNSIIIRMYESMGQDSATQVELFKQPVKIFETDLMENTLKELSVTGKTIPLTFKKFEIKTLKVVF